MTIRITDPVLFAQLCEASEFDLADADGNVVRRFASEPFAGLPPGVELPWSAEEMERRRAQNGTGRPLKDILRDLEGRR